MKRYIETKEHNVYCIDDLDVDFSTFTTKDGKCISADDVLRIYDEPMNKKFTLEELSNIRPDAKQHLVKLGENVDDYELKRTLTEREIKVLEYRKKGRTLEDIGKELGITRERVRQIQNKAERKIKYEQRNN